jgi:hypothetical protein
MSEGITALRSFGTAREIQISGTNMAVGQWGYVRHGYCAVQVASNMALGFQFHNIKHTVACVRA